MPGILSAKERTQMKNENTVKDVNMEKRSGFFEDSYRSTSKDEETGEVAVGDWKHTQHEATKSSRESLGKN
jgi:hypothetical protein